MKTFSAVCLLSIVSFTAAAGSLDAAVASQTITLERSLQIPGGSLAPGEYQFSVEDRLSDRAIVRIQNAASGEHQFLLTVPNATFGRKTANPLVLFAAPDKGTQILRGWLCPGCQRALEMVYPKTEAAQLTAETGQPVMAADPAYDKLPANLSADDMKVVTLWLLSPERVSNQHGVGLRATKYADSVMFKSLPETASTTYAFAVAGIVFLAIFCVLHFQAGRRKRCMS